MNLLEMMGLERKSWYLTGTKPIIFPIRAEKHEEFFRALEKEKAVRYSWKFGRIIVRGQEPLNHEAFAKAVGRNIPTSTDLIRILSASSISCKITEWENYLSFREVKAFEGLIGISRLCLPAPEECAEKKEMMDVGFDVRSLSEKKEHMEPVSFPVSVSNKEDADFFRVLESVRRVTYNYEKGEIYLIDNSTPNHTTVKTISHEGFAKAVGRYIGTSAEMLLLLSVSKISFRITNYEEMVSEKCMTEFNEFLNRSVYADA